VICFRDMTFCSSSQTRCSNKDCHRFFGEYEKQDVKKWWGGDGAPVAWSDFFPGCDIKIEVKDELA